MRVFYDLPRDPKTPQWTRNRCSRLSLPGTDELSTFLQHTKQIAEEEKLRVKAVNLGGDSGDKRSFLDFP